MPKPAVSTQVKADWQKRLNLEHGRDYRMVTDRAKGMFVSFTVEATGELLTTCGSIDKAIASLTSVAGIELEATEIHLDLLLQAVIKPKSN